MLLGGRDFDQNLIDYYINEKKLKDEIYPYLNKMDKYGQKARNDFHLIRDSCEEAKKNFVNDSEQSIMPNILNLEIDDQELNISYDNFIQLNKGLLDKILEPVERILKFCNLPKTEIDDIILVGGSSNIPIVAKKLLGDKFIPIITRNTKLPAKNTHSFISVHNFQAQMTFDIYETESCLCTRDSYLGSLSIELPKLQAGEARVILELSLNEDCILSAKCYVVGHDDPKYSTEKVIRQGGVLSQDFIESRIKNAELSKKSDLKTVEKNTLQNHWNLLHQNAISFVNNYKLNVTINKTTVIPQLDEIIKLAQAEKNKTCTDKDIYNNMVNKYKSMFEDYNKDAPPHRQTIFLNNAKIFQ